MCTLLKGAQWKEGLRWNSRISNWSSESKPDIEQPIVGQEALNAPLSLGLDRKCWVLRNSLAFH